MPKLVVVFVCLSGLACGGPGPAAGPVAARPFPGLAALEIEEVTDAGSRKTQVTGVAQFSSSVADEVDVEARVVRPTSTSFARGDLSLRLVLPRTASEVYRGRPQSTEAWYEETPLG